MLDNLYNCKERREFCAKYDEMYFVLLKKMDSTVSSKVQAEAIYVHGFMNFTLMSDN
jgi:hypothetical protein